MPVANYVPYKLIVNHTPPEATLITSGMIPVVDGKPLYTGKLGDTVSIEQGVECARACALNALGWAMTAFSGNLDRIDEVIRVNGFVACVPGFTDHPRVINGCSDLLVEVFGERGQHTRTAVGMASLPLDVPVEIDFTFKVI